MSKHTPGPWEIEFVKTDSAWDDYFHIFHRNDDGMEVTIAKVLERRDQGADARLIAAAPEMVDKFREALRIITTQTPQHKINEFLKGAAELLRRIDGEGGSNG